VRFLTPSTGTTPREAEQYSVSVSLERSGHRLTFSQASVVVHEVPENDPVQAVVGRDLLAECAFLLNGPASCFMLAF
jgi:hypothetical protein